ncbi:MAG: hypothetical protein L0I20_08600, partial [Lactococcus raffinolactis]|nr:hypothetical protein [Lactococcus raffinolactis]
QVFFHIFWVVTLIMQSREHIKDIVMDYLPKDAKFEGMESAQMYKFYSEVHDTHYSAIFTDLNPGMVLTISSFDETLYNARFLDK